MLASNVEEIKEFLKAALDRLETTDLKEEGAGVKKRREDTHEPTHGRFKHCVYAYKG